MIRHIIKLLDFFIIYLCRSICTYLMGTSRGIGYQYRYGYRYRCIPMSTVPFLISVARLVVSFIFLQILRRMYSTAALQEGPIFFGSILKINQVPLLGFCARPSVPSVLCPLPTPCVVVVRVRRPASVTLSCIGEIGAMHVRPVAPRSAHGMKRNWVEKSTKVRVGV